MQISQIEKRVEALVRRVLATKARSTIVRKASAAGKNLGRNAFRQTSTLRGISIGGAFVGMGVIYLIVTLYDRIKSIAERPYHFVSTNFESSARGWKRRTDRQEAILRRHVWPVYALALRARDIAPPYRDEESFLGIARLALAEDRTLLEGINARGQPTRIPFRQTQKLFAAPPFSTTKNSINDLRFSWYRNIRDRHLGRMRRLMRDLSQSRPFENVLLLGYRRDLLSLISRGLRDARSGVRLEDVVGTADPAFAGEAAGLERDRIRAYIGRKVVRARRSPRERIYFMLEDGLRNAISQIMDSDPELVCGKSLVFDGDSIRLDDLAGDLGRDVERLLGEFGPTKRTHGIDMAAIAAAKETTLEGSVSLVGFLERNDPQRKVLRDVGDLQAARIALQMDRHLRGLLADSVDGGGSAELLERLGEIANRQADYDRALIELRGVYQSCLADFRLYNEFVSENFLAYAPQHPDADYDPAYVKYVPRFFKPIGQWFRRLRQRLQRL